MIISTTLLPLSLALGGDAYALARRVEQSLENRGPYQGGWMLSNPGACPQNYSNDCTNDKSAVNKICCPSGNTCFGSSLGYCCPTSTHTLILCDSIHRCQFSVLTKRYSSGLQSIRYNFSRLRRSDGEYVFTIQCLFLLPPRSHGSYTPIRLWFL
jgi:hypothetical protein